MCSGPRVIFVSLDWLVDHWVALFFARSENGLRCLRFHERIHAVVRHWWNQLCRYFFPQERRTSEILLAWRFVFRGLDAAFCLGVSFWVVVSLLTAYPLGIRQKVDSLRLKRQAGWVSLVDLRVFRFKGTRRRTFVPFLKACNLVCHRLPGCFINITFLFWHKITSDFIICTGDIFLHPDLVVDVSCSFACMDLSN